MTITASSDALKCRKTLEKKTRDTVPKISGSAAKIMKWHSHTRKGFNLIEAAIVLGVVGLVIGGIWVAATHINQERTATDSVVMLSKGVQLYRKYNSGGNTTQTSSIIELLRYEDLPPPFKYDLAGWGTPVIYGQGVVLYDLEGDPGLGLWGSFFFGTYPDGDGQPQPKTCIELSKFLLRESFKYTPWYSIMWSNNGGSLLSWPGPESPQPSMSEVITACGVATDLSFNYIIP